LSVSLISSTFLEKGVRMKNRAVNLRRVVFSDAKLAEIKKAEEQLRSFCECNDLDVSASEKGDGFLSIVMQVEASECSMLIKMDIAPAYWKVKGEGKELKNG
jgi:hypothetical protein